MGSCSFHPDGNHSSFHPGRNSIWLPPLHPAATDIPPRMSTSEIMLRSISPRMTFGILLPPPFPSGCLTSGILLPLPFHPVVLHPEFRSRMGEREFQLLRIYISGSSNSAHPESFATNILRYFSAQCRGVLLKLPDICYRHL